MTNIPLSKTPARQGSLLCKSGPIYIVSFYLFNRHNSLINWGVGLKCLHTSIFTETPSLERLPTKAKEDPLPREIRVSPAGRQPSISWSYYYYYYYYYYYHHRCCHHHYYYLWSFKNLFIYKRIFIFNYMLPLVGLD